MNPDEEKFNIGSAKTEICEFTKIELIAQYNSLLKCEGIWVVINSQPQPLWCAVEKWHGAVPIEEARERLSAIRLLPVEGNATEAEKKG
jgi:hypothetical protein